MRKLFSFGWIGAITAILGMCMMYVLVDGAYWSPVVANVFQLLVTFGLNYELNRRFTWRVSGHDAFVRFLVSRSATLVLTFGVFVAASKLGAHYLPATAVSILVSFIANWYAGNRWVFIDRSTSMSDPDSLRLGMRTLWTGLAIAAVSFILLYLVSGNLLISVTLAILAGVSLLQALLFMISLLYTHRDDIAHTHQALRAPTGRQRTSFAVLMPARKEGFAYAHTIVHNAYMQRHHLLHRIFTICCDDDPDTARIALLAARVVNRWSKYGLTHLTEDDLFGQLNFELSRLDDRLARRCKPDAGWLDYLRDFGHRLVYLSERYDLTSPELDEIAAMRESDALIQPLIFPLGSQKPSKPLQLNYGFEQVGDRFDVCTILDAESLSAEGLLTHVDQAFQDRAWADIIQGGVQLMPPRLEGSAFAQFRQTWSRWFSWPNQLEYYRWFPNQMPFQARIGFVPLGGNTVFVRMPLLRKTEGWPVTLTEDCALGTLATAVHGARTFTFYDPALVTREETPPTLQDLIKQRTRWTQGFLQTLVGGQWRALPTLRQRLVALWILSMAFFQGSSVLLVIPSIITMFVLKSPVILTLIMLSPLGVMALATALQLQQMARFKREFDCVIPWHVYPLLVIMQLPYQFVLSLAAFKAVWRHIKGHTDWQSPARSNDNIAQPLPTMSSVA